jgi:hypothetical protein
MFGPWLALLRRGPDLLRATSLGRDPESVGSDASDVSRVQNSRALSSRDADALIGGRSRAKGLRRSSTTSSLCPRELHVTALTNFRTNSDHARGLVHPQPAGNFVSRTAGGNRLDASV